MKLPNVSDRYYEALEQQCTLVDVATLGCLRSIAVSLETIAAIFGREFHSITDDQYDAVVEQLKAHSVREVPDGDAGAD